MEKVKIYFLYIFLFLSFKYVKPESKYIIEENEISKLLDLLANKEFSMILIYSPYCPHCQRFKPTYDELADAYHSQIHFYQINGVKSRSYEKKFKIDGYPTIFFYYNDKYTEYNGGRSFETMSEYIKQHFFLGCENTNYQNVNNIISKFYNDKNLFNMMIGYFNSSFENTTLKIYHDITNKYHNYIDICYVINDDSINTTLVNNIISFNKFKGTNYFKKFKFLNSENRIGENNKEKLKNDLTRFLNKYTSNVFLGIENDNNRNNFKKINKNLRENLIFTYESQETKNKYIKNILKLSMLNKNYLHILFDYTLYNKNLSIKEFSKLSFSKKEGIYLVDSNLTKCAEIENISLIESYIIENNKKVNGKNSSKIDIKNYLIKYNTNEDYKSQNINNGNNLGLDIRKIILFFIALIIYNITFFIIARKYFCKNEDMDQMFPVSVVD